MWETNANIFSSLLCKSLSGEETFTYDEKRTALALLVSAMDGISFESAVDKIDEAKYNLYELLNGNTEFYDHPNEILFDYFDIGTSYLEIIM